MPLRSEWLVLYGAVVALYLLVTWREWTTLSTSSQRLPIWPSVILAVAFALHGVLLWQAIIGPEQFRFGFAHALSATLWLTVLIGWAESYFSASRGLLLLVLADSTETTAPEIAERSEVVASWYGKEYHGRPMANGKIYNMYANTIAHRTLPLGTKVELTNPDTGQVVRAVVTDRGPFIDGRDVGLSYGIAKKLNMVDKGVGKVIMEIL